MAQPTASTARQQVRRLVQDGQTSDATPVPYKMVRLEDLTDQVSTGQTTFQVRFTGVPTEAYVTCYVIPGSLVAYVDGSPAPTSPKTDVDRNGNFVLSAAPGQQVQVSYGWQYFADSDIDDFVDQARQWLREYTDVTLVPDGLVPALVRHAASKALEALAAKVALPSVSAGEASADLSKLASEWRAQATAWASEATSLRESYWARASEPRGPAFDTGSMALDPYQPQR